MGKIACRYADKIYLTDDNPRHERPNKIREDIKKGIINAQIIEISNRKILELIESIFISNIDILDFSILKGSTGLGILKKICPREIELKKPKYIKKRKNLLLWKIYNKLFQRKQYKHSLDSSQSFLIDVTKY